jgi:hypothetical protein
MAVSDQEIGKRMVEEEHLGLFLAAYQRATGETFPEMFGNETPDFIGKDRAGQTVGVELTQIRFGPEDRSAREIFSIKPDDPEAWWRLLELIHKKTKKLTKCDWPKCNRKILVVMSIDASIDSFDGATETDKPDDEGFDEIWLADFTQFEVFGAVDILAVVHPHLEGRFATGDRGQKPYG